ncbi:MAG: thiamine pyrophosphate-dependent dehydrogenase E1 component subunit alpha [Acidobacteria bacterium]|nr:thiamine pyrophosphate-dependent dehydrogenase E1 component subunit alpha [Acidobacteriota bacterium]
MSEQNGKIDRRSLLKIMGTVGATAVMSACGRRGADSDASLTGGKWEKTVHLATAGPGGNLDWQVGDSIKFLPPQEMATTRKVGDILASLPKDKLLTIYRRMSAIRKWETTLKDLALSGKGVGQGHSYVGQEAIASGVMAALNDDDYIASTHRGHGHLIAKGGDLNKMTAEIALKEAGYNKGYGGSMHITDMSKGILGANGIVGASFYFAAGAAYRAVVLGTKQVAVAFFGDGAANSPYYFSAVRSSTNYKLPVIFVCENNFFAASTAMAIVTPTKYICDYTKGLGIPHHCVDGNDVAAVYAASKEAVDWARAGNGPSIIEGLTYRWYEHSGSGGAKVGVDGSFGLPYRSDEEVRQWMARDPIARFKVWLLEKKLATASELAKIEADTQAAVEASITFALQSKAPDPKAGVLNTRAGRAELATQFYDRRGMEAP